jgi:HEAT repeat protein
LGAIGDVSVVPALLPLLDDLDPDVRGATASSLGQLGDPRVVEGLLRVMKDPETVVSIQAFEALQHLSLEPTQQARFKQLRGELGERLGIPRPNPSVVTDGGP